MDGTREELQQALSRFRWSAWGWESQGIYREPHELYETWCDSGTIDEDAAREWLAVSRHARETGRTVGRVWVHSDPRTRYERFQLDMIEFHREAGEVIGVLDESDALGLGLPDHDFYLFDDELVALPRYNGHVIVGADLVTEPDQVQPYRRWRDVATGEAVHETGRLPHSA